MDSGSLTREQAHRLRAVIARQVAYLGKLRRRMESRGFPPTDPLYVATCRAFAACHELHIRAHYAGCESGVGEQPRDTR